MNGVVLLLALLLVGLVLLVARRLYGRMEMPPPTQDETQEFNRAMREIEERKAA